MTAAKHTPGLSLDDAAKRLVSLRKLARMERKELGKVSAETSFKIGEAIAAAQAVFVVDDARAAIAKAMGEGA